MSKFKITIFGRTFSFTINFSAQKVNTASEQLPEIPQQYCETVLQQSWIILDSAVILLPFIGELGHNLVFDAYGVKVTVEKSPHPPLREGYGGRDRRKEVLR